MPERFDDCKILITENYVSCIKKLNQDMIGRISLSDIKDNNT